MGHVENSIQTHPAWWMESAQKISQDILSKKTKVEKMDIHATEEERLEMVAIVQNFLLEQFTADKKLTLTIDGWFPILLIYVR